MSLVQDLEVPDLSAFRNIAVHRRGFHEAGGTIKMDSLHKTMRLARDKMINQTTTPILTSSIVSAPTNETNPDYSTGLSGVNIILDQQLIKFLWGSMMIVALVVFALRLWQLFSAHIRHVHCSQANAWQQTYWTFEKSSWIPWLKREIIYAPLGKKRHNREWQLSKAINYGTLPGRVHTILLFLYVLSNIIYCLILPYGQEEKAKIIAEFRGRTGILATVNMIPLVLMAGRNNPAISILKISFDTFNLFHRWIGRIVLIESVAHVLAWYANYRARNGATMATESFTNNIFLQSGLWAVLAMAIILFQSLSAVRHAFYETFLHVHQLLALAIFLGVYIHLDCEKLPALTYIRVVVFLWISERIIRLGRLLYLNVDFRRRECSSVTIQALPGEACRVTYQLPRHVTIRPGSHVYAYIPHVSGWMAHPFSVAWTNVESEPPTGPIIPAGGLKSPASAERQSIMPTAITRTAAAPTSLSLVVAARTGMTRQIYDRARAATDQTLVLPGLIEGPYAGHDSLSSFGTVVMFAGGAGITHHLVQIRHLLAAAHIGTVATRKLVLVWSVRDLEALAWVAPWMDEIMRMPGRRDVLSVSMYVTQPRGPADYESPSRSVRLHGGRCSPAATLDKILPKRVGAMMVSVCGPGAFADEVRAAVRERLHLGCIEMNEESFTW